MLDLDQDLFDKLFGPSVVTYRGYKFFQAKPISRKIINTSFIDSCFLKHMPRAWDSNAVLSNEYKE